MHRAYRKLMQTARQSLALVHLQNMAVMALQRRWQIALRLLQVVCRRKSMLYHSAVSIIMCHSLCPEEILMEAHILLYFHSSPTPLLSSCTTWLGSIWETALLA